MVNHSSLTGIEVGKQTMLLPIDVVSLPLRRRLGLYMPRPEVQQEPLLRPGGRDSKAPGTGGGHQFWCREATAFGPYPVIQSGFTCRRRSSSASIGKGLAVVRMADPTATP